MSGNTGNVQTGSILLIVCCLFYLAWWCIAFNPSRSFPMAPKVVLFLCTAVAGVAGVLLTVQGLNELPDVRRPVSSLAIVIGAVVVYLVLLVATSLLLHRQVTTELALITGWTALELCVVNALYGGEVLGGGAAVGAAVVIVVCAVLGMVCYLAYYRLEPGKAFVDGMVPLILFAVAMAFEVLLMR